MKRIISLKKISPFLTEVFRDDAKIGTIDYQDAKNYQINLDDAIAQAVMDTEIAAIKKALEVFMDNFTLEKMQEMENYKNLTLIVDLDRVKNEHVATITQVFNEKKQLLLTDYENYKKNVTTESNVFKTSVETEKKNIIDLSTSETVKIQTEGSKQITDIGLLGDAKKNTLETDYLVYKTELESFVNVNNFEKLIGKNFKGAYDSTKKYENGDIYYKVSNEKTGFSIPNSSTPTVTKNVELEKIEKFLIFGEMEREFQLCNNKQFGVVGLSLGETLIKDGESNTTFANFPTIFSIVSFSIPETSVVEFGKILVDLRVNSPNLPKINLEMPLHKNLIGTVSKYQY